MPIAVHLKHTSKIIFLKTTIEEFLGLHQEIADEIKATMSNQYFMGEDIAGRRMVVPYYETANFSFIEELSDEEMENIKKAIEAAKQTGPGKNRIVTPGLAFPSSRGSKSGGH